MDERRLMEMAVAEARKSPVEDGKPRVGAVVVDGDFLIAAYRSESGLGDHAEYVALENKCRDRALASRCDGVHNVGTMYQKKSSESTVR